MELFEQPLVTIILTTFNQESCINETLTSVMEQSYPFIQLIVIDNASTDGTYGKLEIFQEKFSNFRLIRNSFNKGLCKAFNQGLTLAGGKYIIDLSGDDILLPERLEKQVATFELLSEDYAVVFTNARYIDENGKQLNFHFPVNQNGSAIGKVPAGDVYKQVLEKYFICTPTMMMRTDIVRQMGGYDESLVFEDFDFWVRSSVRFKYHYLDEVLTLKRNSVGSLSSDVYKKGSGMLASYYAVCNKAYDLNRNQEEFDLLAARIRTFIRKCFYAQEFELALQFRRLLNYIENPGLKTELIVFLCRIRLPVNGIYRFYVSHLQKIVNSRKDLGFGIVTY
jgi:glycosyltransferase involved in cell wall biosynthesis